jgi:hypothetical protein
MQNNQLAMIAVVAALAVLRVVVLTVAVTIPLQQQQAEARGCPPESPAANASKTRCFKGI